MLNIRAFYVALRTRDFCFKISTHEVLPTKQVGQKSFFIPSNKSRLHNAQWWNVKIQPAVNPRSLNALLFWIYLKMAPSCWQPSNGVSPTFTRRFNNYGLLCGLMYVSTHVCVCIHSFKIFQCSETYRHIYRKCRWMSRCIHLCFV